MIAAMMEATRTTTRRSESLIYPLEPLVDLLESPVDLFEALANLVEASPILFNSLPGRRNFRAQQVEARARELVELIELGAGGKQRHVMLQRLHQRPNLFGRYSDRAKRIIYRKWSLHGDERSDGRLSLHAVARQSRSWVASLLTMSIKEQFP